VARPLDEYQRKRDFAATPEPRGAAPASAQGGDDGHEVVGGGRFVIQEHDATRLHWDLRLEHEGVLLSWALPRGLPWDPKRNHLAVHTEDHPLEYLDFEGHIPEGSYGAGDMGVWDVGTYEAEKLDDDKLVVVFHGRRSDGRYALFKTDGRNWMIHRMSPPADPDRRQLPPRFDLVVPAPGPVPDGDGWALETRWHGLRAVLTSSGGIVELESPAGERLTDRFPEVRPVGRVLGYTEVALDGVITAPTGDADRTGASPASAERLARRLAAGSDTTRRKLAHQEPVTFVAFDLLWRDGYPRTDRPWHERRAELDDLDLEGPAWATPSAYVGDPAPVVTAAAGAGLSELVAKRVDAPYDPDLDPPPWRLVAVPPATTDHN
jgi:bifunctional non-homologous end joining protein LigD